MVQTWSGCPQIPQDNPTDNSPWCSLRILGWGQHHGVLQDVTPLTLSTGRGRERPGVAVVSF